MLTFSCCKNVLACFLLLALMAIGSSAQTFTLLATFHDYTNGSAPRGALVQGLDGNFYGVTYAGGGQTCNGGCGTVFKITPAGTVTTLYKFVKADGYSPVGGLLLATDGNFYGTLGPALIAFKITPEGTLTILNRPSLNPAAAGLLQDPVNGTFYGTSGGQSGDTIAPGEVFSLTTSGTVTAIHTFCNNSSCGGVGNGWAPLASLFEDINTGKMYGTTSEGGIVPTTGSLCGEAIGCGTIFVIGTGGNLKTLHQFAGTDGYYPTTALAQSSDGNFYGTTYYGGIGHETNGTAFEITPTGLLTTLYNFCSLTNCADGSFPGGLIQATNGNFYGTTRAGGTGSCSCGTFFQLTPSGTLTTLHNFDTTDIADGLGATEGMVQSTDGNLYATTMGSINNGTSGQGSVFKISLGLAPFVKTLPLAAYPGTQIFILGTDLTGATSVTFNGTAARFTVVSPTEITATVPAGSTSGTVQVITPAGTLSSNVPFRIY
jgi:uncharacterized repeat protein (TIGR03803 family)